MDTFQSVTGQTIEKRIWKPEGTPRGVVQLVHGMSEHMRRYEWAAQKLTEAGFVVVGHNHLGHGETAEIKGYFGDRNGWDHLVEDVHRLRLETQAMYPELPYFLLGHSMGSFVVRTYCLKYEKGLTGVILSGTGHFTPSLVAFAKNLSGAVCKLGKAKKPSPFLASVVGAGYNSRCTDVQTPFDWLSRDRERVADYVADPYCGFPFTANGYKDMFDGLSRLYPQKLGTMEKDIPVLMISGEADPVGSYGKGVRQVAQELENTGVRQVKVKLYPGARHELLNEINREEVMTDLTGWLNGLL